MNFIVKRLLSLSFARGTMTCAYPLITWCSLCIPVNPNESTSKAHLSDLLEQKLPNYDPWATLGQGVSLFGPPTEFA